MIRLERKVTKENLLKNALILALLFLAYGYLHASLSPLDESKLGNFLLVISILLVTVCFANFAFSYKHSDMSEPKYRLLSHSTTFLFILLTGLLLESLVIGAGIVYPSLAGITLLFSALLYAGVVLYDFWDLLRFLNK